jgi:hypothetical protein
MYVYSRGGPHTALAPRPSLIYCASIKEVTNILFDSYTSKLLEDILWERVRSIRTLEYWGQ